MGIPYSGFWLPGFWLPLIYATFTKMITSV